MCACAWAACVSMHRGQGGHGSTGGTGVPGSCKTTMVISAGLDPNPPEEQPVLLTAMLSPAPINVFTHFFKRQKVWNLKIYLMYMSVLLYGHL